MKEADDRKYCEKRYFPVVLFGIVQFYRFKEWKELSLHKLTIKAHMKREAWVDEKAYGSAASVYISGRWRDIDCRGGIRPVFL